MWNGITQFMSVYVNIIKYCAFTASLLAGIFKHSRYPSIVMSRKEKSILNNLSNNVKVKVLYDRS